MELIQIKNKAVLILWNELSYNFLKQVSFLTYLLLVFSIPAGASVQSDPLSDRILIKFETSADLSAVRAKTGSDPQQVVQRMLLEAGGRPMEPLFSVPVRQTIQTLSHDPDPGLNRIYEVQLDGSVDAELFAAKLSSMPGVEYAEPRRVRYMNWTPGLTKLPVPGAARTDQARPNQTMEDWKNGMMEYQHTSSPQLFVPQLPETEKQNLIFKRDTPYTPNDSIHNPYQEFHHFERAWGITQGSRDVVIAIVDGGVGYNHPDLENKLWINQAEIPALFRYQIDQNNDGIVTSIEIRQWLLQYGEDYDGDGVITLADALHPHSPLTTGTDTGGNGFVDDLFGWDFWASGGSGGQPVIADNNPIHSGTDHGTHVAGIAAAETDNQTGLAGTGFHARYMAVKAGGIPGTFSDQIGFGYEGIVYAALMGADVINCSWGGPGYSRAELDAIEFAYEQGAVVVTAAGNETSENMGYPAGFKNTLAVGSVTTNSTIASYSNYGYRLDVLATGSNIRSTSYSAGYATYSGTSMATPVVSGLAALLKAQHPEWPPQRIAAQIRSSATPIESANASQLNNKLGRGSIDAYRTVSTHLPGIAIRSYRFVNEAGEKLDVAEDGQLIVDIANIGASASHLSLTLEGLQNTENITISTPTQQAGSLGAGHSAEAVFSIKLEDGYNRNTVPLFKITFADHALDYEDVAFVQYDNILYDVVAANLVQMSIGGDGTIGFTDPLNASGGVGFIPRSSTDSHFDSSNNLLFEGGLMVSLGETAVYDAVRSERGTLSRDFTVETVFRLVEPDPLIGAVREGIAHFVIHEEEVPIARIQLQTYAFDDPALANVIYVKYTLTNPSPSAPLEDLHVGLFNDWDMGEDVWNNSTAFSEADSILYFFDASENSTEPVVAVAHLGTVSSLFAIDNAASSGPDLLHFGIYDGFTDEEKIISLKAGAEVTTISNADVSGVVASGPYTLNPEAAIIVGFVYAFGNDLKGLRQQVASAREQVPFSVSPAGVNTGNPTLQQALLFQNYPNPFSGATQIKFDLDRPSPVRLTVYDVLGRKLRLLVDEGLEAGTHLFTFDGDLYSSGIYFIQLITDTDSQVIPMTLIK